MLPTSPPAFVLRNSDYPLSPPHGHHLPNRARWIKHRTTVRLVLLCSTPPARDIGCASRPDPLHPVENRSWLPRDSLRTSRGLFPGCDSNADNRLALQGGTSRVHCGNSNCPGSRRSSSPAAGKAAPGKTSASSPDQTPYL